MLRMSKNLLAQVDAALDALRQTQSIRSTHRVEPFTEQGHALVNLVSNDTLGVARDGQLKERFLQQVHAARLGSGASRVLSGSSIFHDQLEQGLAVDYGRPDGVLLAQSGWHLNTTILPALTKLAPKKTLILLDQLIHASFIDGAQMAHTLGAKIQRFKHNDLAHLTHFLQKYGDDYTSIFVVVESLYSMDGDFAPLTDLVALKKAYPHLVLVVDEAHAVGAYGATGLGLSQVHQVLDEIDILIGTFGKAYGGVGAFLATDPSVRTYLANSMRSLIFSTALPPMCMAWTDFVRKDKLYLAQKRALLHSNARYVREGLGLEVCDNTCSHIIAVVIGENDACLKAAKLLKTSGFLVGAIRPPTVRPGRAQLRLSVSAQVSTDDLDRFLETMQTLQHKGQIVHVGG